MPYATLGFKRRCNRRTKKIRSHAGTQTDDRVTVYSTHSVQTTVKSCATQVGDVWPLAGNETWISWVDEHPDLFTPKGDMYVRQVYRFCDQLEREVEELRRGRTRCMKELEAVQARFAKASLESKDERQRIGKELQEEMLRGAELEEEVEDLRREVDKARALMQDMAQPETCEKGMQTLTTAPRPSAGGYDPGIIYQLFKKVVWGTQDINTLAPMFQEHVKVFRKRWQEAYHRELEIEGDTHKDIIMWEELMESLLEPRRFRAPGGYELMRKPKVLSKISPEVQELLRQLIRSCLRPNEPRQPRADDHGKSNLDAEGKALSSKTLDELRTMHQELSIHGEPNVQTRLQLIDEIRRSTNEDEWANAEVIRLDHEPIEALRERCKDFDIGTSGRTRAELILEFLLHPMFVHRYQEARAEAIATKVQNKSDIAARRSETENPDSHRESGDDCDDHETLVAHSIPLPQLLQKQSHKLLYECMREQILEISDCPERDRMKFKKHQKELRRGYDELFAHWLAVYKERLDAGERMKEIIEWERGMDSQLWMRGVALQPHKMMLRPEALTQICSKVDEAMRMNARNKVRRDEERKRYNDEVERCHYGDSEYSTQVSDDDAITEARSTSQLFQEHDPMLLYECLKEEILEENTCPESQHGRATTSEKRANLREGIAEFADHWQMAYAERRKSGETLKDIVTWEADMAKFCGVFSSKISCHMNSCLSPRSYLWWIRR